MLVSLFTSNLSPSVTNRDLFAVFCEAGPVFDVFVQKDKLSGSVEGLVLFVLKLNGM